MISLRPFDDRLAFDVFRNLDPWDWIEAEHVRGQAVTSAGLFADWRSIEGARLLSHVVVAERDHELCLPFAVIGLCHTGQAGVASAALLSRKYDGFRRELAELAVEIRRQLPEFCAEAGVRRIEARAWTGHPTASRLLTALGFVAETDMPGFGAFGTATFRQFAYIPTPTEET